VPGTTGTNGIASFVPLVTKGAGEADTAGGSNVDENYLFGLNTAGAGGATVLAADFEEGAGQASPNLNHPISGTTPILTGTWYHAAVTYDGSRWRLFLNGVLEAEQYVGQLPRSDSVQYAALGTTLRSNGVLPPAPTPSFDGTLDEVRIWRIARSATDIRSTVNQEITSSDPDLVARWALDEGANTTVGGSAGTSISGNILGSGSQWVAGAPFDLVRCQTVPSSVLRFDGANDFVTFGNPAELGLATFTIETWFNRQGAGVVDSTGNGGIPNFIPLVTKGAGEADTVGGSNLDENYLFGLNTAGPGGATVLAADFEEGVSTGGTPNLNHPISGVTPILERHLVPRGGHLRRHDATPLPERPAGRYAAHGRPSAALGQHPARRPRHDHPVDRRRGRLLRRHDVEVRIWDHARSAGEISTNYLQALTSGPGLVAAGDCRTAPDSRPPTASAAPAR
jgi:hypothetical protein